MDHSIFYTLACELRERCGFYGIDWRGSKKEKFERLTDHKAKALTVLDTFVSGGSNIESYWYLKIIKLTEVVSSASIGPILKK